MTTHDQIQIDASGDSTPAQPVLQRSIGGEHHEIDALLSELRTHLHARMRVFVRSWAGVDRIRDRAAAAGLADRISIHHRAALGCLGLPRIV
jgi:hypothetical protein